MIDPEGFVTKSATLDTGAITGSASQLRTMGGEVKYRVEDVEKSWGGLGGCYEAPEQDRVYALMKPAADDAHGLNTVLRSAAGHLDTYAATLDGIKPRLADLERRARAFRSEVICGVRVDASEAKDASMGDKAVGLVDWVPGVDEAKKTVPWHEDPATSAKNAKLLREYASLVQEVSSAAASCANRINELVEDRRGTDAAGGEATPVASSGSPLPWGSAAGHGRSCPDVVGTGSLRSGAGSPAGCGASSEVVPTGSIRTPMGRPGLVRRPSWAWRACWVAVVEPVRPPRRVGARRMVMWRRSPLGAGGPRGEAWPRASGT